LTGITSKNETIANLAFTVKKVIQEIIACVRYPFNFPTMVSLVGFQTDHTDVAHAAMRKEEVALQP